MSAVARERVAGLVAVGVSALVGRGATAALRRWPPGGAGRWTRTNHAGRPISLLEGPGYVAGSLAGAGAWSVSAATVAPSLVAAGGAGLAGLIDDLFGDSGDKGLRGHLRALRRGKVSTGVVKIVLLAGAGVGTAYLIDQGNDRALPVPTTLLGAGVVAGAANLSNLLDLRPGRALKATLLAAAPLTIGALPANPDAVRIAASAAGAALGTLRADLAGETMLGDTGANAAGALLGAALVARTGLLGRTGALGVLTALTLLSEKRSFTSIIESTPVLRELDAWGRG